MRQELEPVTTPPSRQYFTRNSTAALKYKAHLYHTADQIKNIEDEIKSYVKKINEDIGFYWRKRYIYTAFWSNISTPINLAIIILTAITTGENATQNLIGQNVSTILGMVVLFVSIFNTFFQPNEQLAQNKKMLADWLDIGAEFDEIYYDKVYTPEEKYSRLKNLEELFKSVSVLKRTNDSNFLIDLLYACMRCICLRNNINWIDMRNEDYKLSKNLRLSSSEQSVSTDADSTHTNTGSITGSSTNSENIHVTITTV